LFAHEADSEQQQHHEDDRGDADAVESGSNRLPCFQARKLPAQERPIVPPLTNRHPYEDHVQADDADDPRCRE
jgi:hypothetical protein